MSQRSEGRDDERTITAKVILFIVISMVYRIFDVRISGRDDSIEAGIVEVVEDWVTEEEIVVEEGVMGEVVEEAVVIELGVTGDLTLIECDDSPSAPANSAL